jgi:CHASE3 domain sensor protein
MSSNVARKETDMANQSDYPDARDDTEMERDEAAPRTPRWVIVFGVIAILLVVALVVLVLAGGHDPSRFQH